MGRKEYCSSRGLGFSTLNRHLKQQTVWSLWALSELDGQQRSYRLLERVEGVSQKSLTATLSGLERDGFVRRSITAQVPIRVDYEATALGHELIVKFQRFFWSWSGKGRGVHSRMIELDS
jgi:DNA-binding HxlR family transcriptional regulator